MRIFSFISTAVVVFFVGGCGNLTDIPIVYHPGMQFDAQAKMVIIVSFDGLRPDAIAPAGAEHITSLAEAGVSAKTAHTIMPSITLPSHSSMLSGVSPAQHGINWNSWDPSRGTIRVPTLFDEAKKLGLKTAMVVGKEKFKHLARPGTVDQFVYDDGDAQEIAEAATSVIKASSPNVLFIHFAHADNVGHAEGWMTADQFEAIHEADQGLGVVFQALKNLGLLESTAVIATADHGGSGRGHGDASEESTRIPWLAAGAGIPKERAGGFIEKPLTTYDTAATAASLLNIPIPASWDGKSAFDN